jgi:hypothetical protein
MFYEVPDVSDQQLPELPVVALDSLSLPLPAIPVQELIDLPALFALLPAPESVAPPPIDGDEEPAEPKLALRFDR